MKAIFVDENLHLKFKLKVIKEGKTMKNVIEMAYNWNDIISKIDKDISEYLKKRYDDYCNDRNEADGIMWGEGIGERHQAKRDQLIEIGFKLKKKLSFFLPESRKELFEQAYNELKSIDMFFMNKYDDFCKELEETNKDLSLQEQRDLYSIHRKKADKKKGFLNLKENLRDKGFMEDIDKRKAKYDTEKAEYEKKKAEYERIELKKKIEEERIANKKGHSNIKPISFYDKLYCRYGSPFGRESFCISMELYEIMQQERDWDIFFEEKGRPKNYDYRCPKKRPLRYKYDSPEGNECYLDRCKQLFEVFKALGEDDVYDENDFRSFQDQIDIYQEYLDKGYLITRQIAHSSKGIGDIFWNRIDYKTRKQMSDSTKPKYKINIFNNDSFDIEEIKIKVNDFINGKEAKSEVILTPIEYLKEFLKKNNNRITIVRYATLINQSYKVALRILKGFVADKKLKVKREAKGKLIFYL